MLRRDILVALGGALLSTTRLHAKSDKPAGVPTIGVLWHAGSAEKESDYLPVLRSAFASLGYTEGKNINLVHRFPAEQAERFRSLAKELVESEVDVLVAVTMQGALSAKAATTTIPIVVVAVNDPIKLGMAESLAHPGANITGLALPTFDLSAKHLSLLQQAVPKLTRVGCWSDSRNVSNQQYLGAYRSAAETLGLVLQPVEISDPGSIRKLSLRCPAALIVLLRQEVPFSLTSEYSSAQQHWQTKCRRWLLALKWCHLGRLCPMDPTLLITFAKL